MFVTVDRTGGRAGRRAFEDELRRFLEPFRLAGHDLEIDAPRFVPLELALTVCVAPGYVRGNVQAALLEAFSSRDCRRRRGFFHPDNFTFGQPVYLSRDRRRRDGACPASTWVEVDGASSAAAQPAARRAASAGSSIGRLEIARLDNDPNRPENGRHRVRPEGRPVSSIRRPARHLRLLRAGRAARRRSTTGPGSPALAYRIGTHGTLPAPDAAAHRRVDAARGPDRAAAAAAHDAPTDDPAIALLDAWATVGDVLTFYQERIANEGYLRTATERRSVLELARAIGYELSPGVAATTYLVFEVEAASTSRTDAAGMAPAAARRSCRRHEGAEHPGPGRAAADVRDERRPDRPQRLERAAAAPDRARSRSASARRELYIAGIATGFVRGDRVLITGRPRTAEDAARRPLQGVDMSLLEVLEVRARGRARTARASTLEALPEVPAAGAAAGADAGSARSAGRLHAAALAATSRR